MHCNQKKNKTAKATTPKTVTFYDYEAFINWLTSLADAQAVSTINRRVERLKAGNMGDTRFVGDGVWELRIHLGPGYRVYFANDGDVVVIILHASTKRRQSANIKMAQGIWQEMQNEI